MFSMFTHNIIRKFDNIYFDFLINEKMHVYFLNNSKYLNPSFFTRTEAINQHIAVNIIGHTITISGLVQIHPKGALNHTQPRLFFAS